ncbi:N-acetylhexosamine 1-kinase [soil metagenome]
MLEAFGSHFQILGQFRSAVPLTSGHINDSFATVYDQAGTLVRYVHQRINTEVFRDPEAVMRNVTLVTDHARAQLLANRAPDASRRTLTLVPTRDGAPFFRDPEGGVWRTYLSIAGSRTFDTAPTPALAYQAAKAFGQFATLLADLDLTQLTETIPDFHNTPARVDAFGAALGADSHNRAREARPEIAFLEERAPALASRIVDALHDGSLPLRVAHNDTKINNVMIDDATAEGLCVIDLDTVMPGTLLYDFGDLVRASASAAPEDERDLSKVMVQVPMFRALVQGYLDGLGPGFLTPTERELLVFSAKLLAFELALRFLTDFLAGDPYFKTHRPGHNLDRARTQIHLLKSMEYQEEALAETVEKSFRMLV